MPYLSPSVPPISFHFESHIPRIGPVLEAYLARAAEPFKFPFDFEVVPLPASTIEGFMQRPKFIVNGKYQVAMHVIELFSLTERDSLSIALTDRKTFVSLDGEVITGRGDMLLNFQCNLIRDIKP
jgi:hypothetical protein